MAPLFGGVSSLEDCNLGTAKRNPGPRSSDRGNARHYRCARLRKAQDQGIAGVVTFGAAAFIRREMRVRPTEVPWGEAYQHALGFIALAMNKNGYSESGHQPASRRAVQLPQIAAQPR